MNALAIHLYLIIRYINLSFNYFCNFYRIIVIDNYVDESVLVQLDNRDADVSALIYTGEISRTFRQSVNRHNRQYAPIDIRTADRIHDRFLIIDDTLYHIGASIKDLGKKLFAFSKLEISPDYILDNL